MSLMKMDVVQVTRLLAELRMDKDSLIAGLLHDTVEDNPGQITFEEIGVRRSGSGGRGKEVGVRRSG